MTCARLTVNVHGGDFQDGPRFVVQSYGYGAGVQPFVTLEHHNGNATFTFFLKPDKARDLAMRLLNAADEAVAKGHDDVADAKVEERP